MTAGTGVDVYGYPLAAEDAAAWQRAVAFSQRGALTAAVDTMSAVLAARPDFVPAMVQLSHWLLAQDRYRDARALARRAASAAPRSHELSLEIVRLLRRFEDPVRIDELVRRVEWSRCGSALLLVRLAAELGPIGLYAQAQSLVAIAAKLDPSLPQLAHVEATLQLVSGELGQARAALRQLADANSPQTRRCAGCCRCSPPPRTRRCGKRSCLRIGHFFQHYKDLEKGKWVKLDGCGGATEARQLLADSIVRYNDLPEKPNF